jgi:anti-anti-sigma regulatory factor
MTEDTAMGVRLVLEGALTIRTVETIRATLREAIEPGPGASISIDCCNATEVDLTFVQLLVAARVTGQLLGKTVSLAGPPDGALLYTLTRGGFTVVGESEAGSSAPEAFWFTGADA